MGRQVLRGFRGRRDGMAGVYTSIYGNFNVRKSWWSIQFVFPLNFQTKPDHQLAPNGVSEGEMVMDASCSLKFWWLKRWTSACCSWGWSHLPSKSQRCAPVPLSPAGFVSPSCWKLLPEWEKVAAGVLDVGQQDTSIYQSVSYGFGFLAEWHIPLRLA